MVVGARNSVAASSSNAFDLSMLMASLSDASDSSDQSHGSIKSKNSLIQEVLHSTMKQLDTLNSPTPNVDTVETRDPPPTSSASSTTTQSVQSMASAANSRDALRNKKSIRNRSPVRSSAKLKAVASVNNDLAGFIAKNNNGKNSKGGKANASFYGNASVASNVSHSNRSTRSALRTNGKYSSSNASVVSQMTNGSTRSQRSQRSLGMRSTALSVDGDASSIISAPKRQSPPSSSATKRPLPRAPPPKAFKQQQQRQQQQQQRNQQQQQYQKIVIGEPAPERDEDIACQYSLLQAAVQKKERKSFFGSLKRSKPDKARPPANLNRISATGVIETIVYKDDDGKEKAYKGKLRRCPSGDRMLLELSAVSEEDDVRDDDLADIELGTNHSMVEARDETSSSCKTLELSNRVDGCQGIEVQPFLASLVASPCGPVATTLFGSSSKTTRDTDKDANHYACEPSPNRGGLDGLQLISEQPIKKVRFSFREGAEADETKSNTDGENNDDNNGNTTKSKQRKKAKKSRRKKKRKSKDGTEEHSISDSASSGPWPLSNTALSMDEMDQQQLVALSVQKRHENSNKVMKVCLVGIACTFTVGILAMCAMLGFFFVRAYRANQEAGVIP